MFDSVSEARAFGRYVLGREINDRAVNLYVRASERLGYDGDDPAVRFSREHRWSIGALDGALALTKRDALLRKKLLLMSAVLETQPEYCDSFLPRDRSPLYAFSVLIGASFGVLSAGIGVLMLRFLR